MDGLFADDPDDTEAALMAATYRALVTHGYADLTIQAIGEEFDKSTSLLYHHYDGKDDLLVAFLGYLLERFEAELPPPATDDPWTELLDLLDHLVGDPGGERGAFLGAMVELRGQAGNDPDYRAAFTRHDAFFHERVTDLVRAGVERGQFRDVDPTAVAAAVQTALNGAMLQAATTDEGVPDDRLRTELEAMLRARLRLDDADTAETAGNDAGAGGTGHDGDTGETTGHGADSGAPDDQDADRDGPRPGGDPA
jgi:AcrR family transcriptional regulator